MEYIIRSCSGLKIEAKKGQTISVIDMEGGQVADFFAEAAENPNEFLSTGVTIDCNESLKLNVGDILYSNFYNPLLKFFPTMSESTICSTPAAVPKCMISFTVTAKITRTALII